MGENTLRLYSDLAWLWPLWEDADEYAPWCDSAAQLIRQYSQIEVQSVLNMGCGGGKNAFNLKRHFEVTGIDISPTMLDLEKKLNPECTFIQADIRSCSLGRQFDCIFIDDVIESMAQPDLAATLRTAFEHLRGGGVMVVSPGDPVTRESFRQNNTRISHARSRLKPENIDVVFIENYYDPDPTDDSFEFTIVYLIREDGKLRVEIDRQTNTFVSMEVWRTTICEAGFDIHDGSFSEDDKSLLVLACVKPQ